LVSAKKVKKKFHACVPLSRGEEGGGWGGGLKMRRLSDVQECEEIRRFNLTKISREKLKTYIKWKRLLSGQVLYVERGFTYLKRRFNLTKISREKLKT
jgi:hypothetical protein